MVTQTNRYISYECENNLFIDKKKRNFLQKRYAHLFCYVATFINQKEKDNVY